MASNEEYGRLLACCQIAMERAGEPIPIRVGRLVEAPEEQRQRLTAQGTQVYGLEVVREPCGVGVRPGTKASSR